MPWFPDFVSAVELARHQTRSVGLADPVQRYFNAFETGRTHELEEIWPGEVVIYDPREGEVRGHRQLRQFVRNNQSLWAERHARIETVACPTAWRASVTPGSWPDLPWTPADRSIDRRDVQRT